MAKSRKRLTIIVPVYNEAPNVAPLYKAVSQAVRKLAVQTEVMFVDDGSSDGSVKEVKKLRRQYANVVLVEMTRNFGKEIAITAGLHQTTADGALMIDADLQHPPSLIPEFVKRWQAGAEVVVGVRSGGEHSTFRTAASKMFYTVLNRISQTPITPSATDYRLLDRVVIDEFNRFTERNRLSRGLIDWLGFRHEYIPFEVAERRAGESYSRLKLITLALNSFVSHSHVPLKLAGYLGILIILVAGPLGLFIFLNRFVLNDPFGFGFTSPAMLAVFNLFLIGVVLTCLGLIALYIANIHAEVMNRPIYVIRPVQQSKPRRTKS